MSEKYTVVHKKSRVVTEGQPKLPSASTIEYGEIAINYAEGYETLSIKNSNNEIATFSSDHVVNSALTEIQDSIDEIQSALTEDELVISTSLSDLNDRVEGLESVSIPYNTSDLNNDSGFITSADTAHTHTAAEVGAMATSERSNYLPTGTTLDNVSDGSTRKLANYSLTSHTHTAAEVGAMATSERSNYLTTATTIPSVEPYFDDVEYDSGTKRINFKHNGTVKDYVDATDFIKDGMVDSVAISTPTGGTNSGVTCLVITFNTDAGKDDIEIPLSNIFNPSNYYNKTETDEKFLSISAYTEDEEVVASALNDLNSRIENMSVPQYVSELINDNAYISSAETEERYSLTSHTHSQYATTAHTHTAAEVGAMATSERSNYLPTGTTLDNVADGSTRKLSNYSTTAHTHTAAEVGAMATGERSNYSTTGHTHNQYATTAHTHTAAEVGAMATSERSNYATTAHTHTAAEVGAMATSERSNYSTTGHTHSQYATTAHTHTAAEVGAMATSERSNYSTTAHTHDQYSLTSHTHTAAEVGAMATSERSNYSTTAHTHTAAEVGAMATSERSNYSTTGHTHSQYATTAHTHTAAEVGAMATSERSNYATTAHTHTAAEVGAMATSERSNYLTTATTIPTESTIAGSGFTKNAITGINVNGTAATITNGVAEINVQGGGGSTLPSVTAADNGKVLMVVDGAWAVVMPTTVYTGTDTPLSSIGNDGDIYLQTS